MDPNTPAAGRRERRIAIHLFARVKEAPQPLGVGNATHVEVSVDADPSMRITLVAGNMVGEHLLELSVGEIAEVAGDAVLGIEDGHVRATVYVSDLLSVRPPVGRRRRLSALLRLVAASERARKRGGLS